eukprot:TRINITY_DN13692_c0_g1_i1.p1 TRINITY_DN13692_c0_g1~~TRINITY_DN13692_c0_g1_i1.p1  ORF type:complete len:128 (+),score=23.51 TRINITY_DN13692_c0_g1_i1:53-385(+)
MKHPAVGWWVAVIVGLGLNAYIAFSRVPIPTLASDGVEWSGEDTTARAALRWIFIAACVAHIFEGLHARSLAQKHDPDHVFGWWVQTTILGFPSLRLIRAIAQRNAKKTH